MSSITRWTYVEGPLTVWRPGGKDRWGVPTPAEPYLVPAIDYETGGEVRTDDNGDQFVPSLIAYFEAAEGSSLVPERNWYVKLGDHTNLPNPPDDAEKIRAITKWPMTKFGADELPDWRIMT